MKYSKYRIIKNAFLWFLVLAFAGMWAKEATERRARQAADQFLGPTLEQFKWVHSAFIPGIWMDSKGRKHGFKWLVYYEHRFMFGEPQVVEVDLLGHIFKSDNALFDSWISLSDSERKKEQTKWSESERQKLCPK